MHDATRAALRLVLAQQALSSQLIDNLNASIHIRALLTDIFLIDETLKGVEAMADAARPRLGVIGLGAMGARIATRLVWQGFNPQVYDVVDVAVRMFTNDVGGMMSGSPKMMAQSCDVVITVLPSAEALRDVLYGWEGLAGGFRPGGTIIDMGAADPLSDRDLAKQLAERGIDLIDAPALGTPADARAGKLTADHRRRRSGGGTLPTDLCGAGGRARCTPARRDQAMPVRRSAISCAVRRSWRPARRCASASDSGWTRRSVVEIGEMPGRQSGPGLAPCCANMC